VALGTVLGSEGERWRIRMAGSEQLLPLDPSVDPLLLEEARLSGARALLELGPGGPRLVGVVQTSRALRIDREGTVDETVERFSVQARKEALLRTLSSFLRLKDGEVELRGIRTLVRAREMAKVLARIISLN
ncbi:MAG TPA: hypothetical protein VFI53_21405, partial [Myxococcaceae bacterium]|nr:hypothetical protein [Myxococcaceae bacterium]